jgi:hypothetical protein
MTKTSHESKCRWMCPNGCEVDHVLVCGGPFLDDPDRPNMYFRMEQEGGYTDLYADGTQEARLCA